MAKNNKEQDPKSNTAEPAGFDLAGRNAASNPPDFVRVEDFQRLREEIIAMKNSVAQVLGKVESRIEQIEKAATPSPAGGNIEQRLAAIEDYMRRANLS